jgi:protein ImuA
MSRSGTSSSIKERETISELKKRLGLFSFQQDARKAKSGIARGSTPELGIRAGGIVEWLVEGKGIGAVSCAMRLLSRSGAASHKGMWALVDPARELYAPGILGWGVATNRMLLVRPETLQETCWTIEQCLRCSGVSATWAWVDSHLPERVHRRWQLAAEVGGGIGVFFRPATAAREAAWADLRLRVTPLPMPRPPSSGQDQGQGQGEGRWVRVEVLYRRGGMGGEAQVWEVDHAAGLVHLVPEVAYPTIAERAARA